MNKTNTRRLVDPLFLNLKRKKDKATLNLIY